MKLSATTKSVLPYILLTMLSLAVYLRTVFFNYVYFDDNFLIIDNIRFLQNINNVFTAFKQDVFRLLHGNDIYYRPLLTVSFILDAQFSGVNPWGYHLSNIVIHLLNCFLLYKLLQKMSYPEPSSFFVSAIFAVLPVLTQAIAWIPGRNDSLVTLFILISLVSYLNFLEKRSVRSAVIAVLGFAGAMFTKETAVLVLFLYFAYWWIKRREDGTTENWGIITALTAGIAVTALWYILRGMALEEPIKLSIFDLILGMVINSPAVIQFLGKILLPFNLSPLALMQDTSFVYGIISVIICVVLVILTSKKRWYYLVFGILWLILFMIPSFARPDKKYGVELYEHRMYFPVIGFLIFLLETRVGEEIKNNGSIVNIIKVVVITLLSLVTFTYSSVFSDKLPFWQAAVKGSPASPLAHRNLGVMYYFGNDFDKAEFHYRKALELNPYEPMAHNNLGLIYSNKNMLSEAEQEFNNELRINPSYDIAHFNLGLLYYRSNRFDLAEKFWKDTLKLNPDYAEAHYDLAVMYCQANRYDYARFHLTKAQECGYTQISPQLVKLLACN
ncbi:MAG: tetratricopeptide repeat protein [Elusimicrobiota bacterium]